ncbi:predicted protein [Nematostella vectensis]|uniref:Uncharacterized protein n=1 Tax=Nematostella vectensis TaxID=45351 RepID=A7SAN3_NEMVE|nr:predicted protein [Nematostella vectensis]|eukprot:XP_001631285.1 predicted protein [Nematostella vectensis]
MDIARYYHGIIVADVTNGYCVILSWYNSGRHTVTNGYCAILSWYNSGRRNKWILRGIIMV